MADKVEKDSHSVELEKILILLRRHDPFPSSTVLLVNLENLSLDDETEEPVCALIDILTYSFWKL